MSGDESIRTAPAGLIVAALRASTPRALAIVARRIGDFDDAEDAVQEAVVVAASDWARSGVPQHPVAWLVTTATRRAIDTVRSEAARRERERRAALAEPVDPEVRDVDDTLSLFLLCAHPALTRTQRVTLTLRAVGGLTTREIARGLMVPEPTVAQRITRAKATLRREGVRFPAEVDPAVAAPSVVDVLGVIHTEAHTATDGEEIARPVLGAEAVRLARELLARTPAAAPWRGELLGLLALMLFTDARAPARLGPAGQLVPLREQDRSRWRADFIAEGEALLSEALTRHAIGPMQLRAAIAGVHAAAARADDTDWLEVLGLYDLLAVADPSPVVALGRLVALAEVAGPDAALREWPDAAAPAPSARAAAVRAHLLERAGRPATAAYREAAALARNGAERRWLQAKAASVR